MGWSERLLEQRRREVQATRGRQAASTAETTLVDYETGERFVRSYQCPDCRHRAMLVNRWNAAASSYEVVCGGCGRTSGFVREKSLTQRWRENPDAVPIHVANKLAERHGGEPMTSQALARADEQTLAQRIAQARWLGQLSPQDRTTLARLAIEYRLDPLMGELVLYEGRPYISLSGMIRLAHEHPEFEGVEDRPMTTEEREAYGITQPIAWIAKIYRRRFRVPTVGTGAADPQRPFRNNPVERERPQWMARARAIRQALRLAFPHSTPFRLEAAEERGVVVDQRTGEVVECEPAPATSSEPAGDAPSEEEVEAAAVNLAFDDSDLPGEGAADSEESEESRRQAVLDALREHLANPPRDARGRDRWKRFCEWWGTRYPETPESGALADLQDAYRQLVEEKR